MPRIERILFAYDGFDRNERLPAQAIAFALGQRAHLHIAHVMPDLTAGVWRFRSARAGELQATLVAARRGQLAQLEQSVRERGVDVSAEVRVGKAHLELIQAAADARADLVMLIDEPRGRDRGRSFGATTMKLLRDCPQPVWALRSATATHARNILAAVDLGPEGAEENAPNQKILDVATQVAGADARLYLFHAWSVWGEDLLRRHAGMREYQIDELVEDTKQAAHQRMNALAAGLQDGAPACEIVIRKGDARALIPELVNRLEIDLVVMGSVARTGLPGFVIGNTAERILNRLTCSVITVKPDGFASPALEPDCGRTTAAPPFPEP